MDKLIRARFFQVEPAGGSPEFENALEEAYADGRAEWTEAAEGTWIRLSDLAQNGQLVSGDIVRQQKDNLPPFADDDGELEPNTRPLGHRAAFLYDRRLSILVLESRREVVTPTRLSMFLAKACDVDGYEIFPALSRDALRKLQAGTVTSFTFRVARPENLEHVEDGNEDIAALQELRHLYGGPQVTVTVGLGKGPRRGRHLNRQAVMSTVRKLMRVAARQEGPEEERADVRGLQVGLVDEDRPLNLLASQIVEQEEIELPEDIGANFERRLQFIRAAYAKHRTELRELYGDA